MTTKLDVSYSSIEFTDRSVCQWVQQVQLQLITNVSGKQDNGHYMFNNNNNCIYKALSNKVLNSCLKIKKINKNNPVQTTIRTRKNRISFEKLHTDTEDVGQ